MEEERWSPQQLAELGRAAELEIAAPRRTGEWGRRTPIWVVVVGGDVVVRTWVRRDTGWYGGALRSGRARVRLLGAVDEVAVAPADVAATREAVDAAYRAKYGVGAAGSMTTDEAVASTLRLTPSG